eukprot:3075753-Prymnesium_polylepis.3
MPTFFAVQRLRAVDWTAERTAARWRRCQRPAQSACGHETFPGGMRAAAITAWARGWDRAGTPPNGRAQAYGMLSAAPVSMPYSGSPTMDEMPHASSTSTETRARSSCGRANE